MSRTSWFTGPLARRLCTLSATISALAGCSSNLDQQGAASNDIGQQGSAVVTTTGVDADSYVRSTSAGTNFGNATTLLADGSDGGAVMETFIRFSIGNVGTINSAKLRLWVVNTTAGPYNVKKVSSNTWTETGITWNNKPAVDGPTVATFPSASSGTWLEINITSVAQPNTTISLAIVTTGTTDGLDFSSRNATTQPAPGRHRCERRGHRRNRRRRRHGRNRRHGRGNRRDRRRYRRDRAARAVPGEAAGANKRCRPTPT